MLCITCAVQIQPRKRVSDHAQHTTATTRQCKTAHFEEESIYLSTLADLEDDTCDLFVRGVRSFLDVAKPF